MVKESSGSNYSSHLDLFKSSSEMSRVNNNMSIRVQQSPRVREE